MGIELLALGLFVANLWLWRLLARCQRELRETKQLHSDARMRTYTQDTVIEALQSTQTFMYQYLNDNRTPGALSAEANAQIRNRANATRKLGNNQNGC